MMQSTVMLQGEGSLGTGFLLLRPFPSQGAVGQQIRGRIVLVTAAHVFEEMKGEQALMTLRSREGQSDKWDRKPFRLKIRNGSEPLWKKSPEADVAVMYISLPIVPFDKVIPIDLLATDELLKANTIGPGVELKCLGYPFGAESSPAGFAILRTGDIASYPLLPTADTKTFLFDFRVFKDNSGGPVYFSQPQFRGSVQFGGRAQFIMGLVSEEKNLSVLTTELYETKQTTYPLSLGVVVHASLIRRAIDLLPSPETSEAEKVFVTPVPIQ